MNNHFTGSHLPANLNANNSGNIILNTTQVELVNEKLEYQNHQLQKNLVKHEHYVQRYWHNENDKQMIVNNEWNKYNSLIQNERWFLSNNHISRDGDIFYYQPNHNHKVTGLPTYRKIGKSQKPRIVFPIDSVASFMVLNTN